MIDALSPADATAAASLSASFKWPHRAEDWAFFLSQGNGVGWREDGALLGTAMCFPLDATHGTIGLVQVASSLQGRGIGARLTAAAIELGAGRNLALHATAAGAGLYARLGFVARGTVQQWQGTATQGDASMRLAAEDDLSAILALDRAGTGLQREVLLWRLVQEGVVHLSGPDAAPTGFAIRRHFGRGALIGPVIAGSLNEAAALVASLAVAGFNRVDIPAGPDCLAPMLAQTGLASVEDVQIMVRGDWPRAPGLFALSSQAMG